MKHFATFVLILIIAASGFYIYQMIFAVCKVPLEYRIGMIDEGFDISLESAINAVGEAESMWENLTGKDLFTYSEDAAFVVNFVFDTRQQTTNEAHELKEVLDEKEGMSETIRAQYDMLSAQYQTLKTQYEQRVEVYESDLAAHNKEVAYWNGEGGAPEDVYKKLNAKQRELSAENNTLAKKANELNRLVANLNNLSEKGNQVVDDYNEDVEAYNNRFNHEYEFTQGDYQGDHINIYQFDNDGELRTVLAHELGHALSLEHVEDPDSVMYYLMDVESNHRGLTLFDWREFKRVCGE